MLTKLRLSKSLRIECHPKQPTSFLTFTKKNFYYELFKLFYEQPSFLQQPTSIFYAWPGVAHLDLDDSTRRTESMKIFQYCTFVPTNCSRGPSPNCLIPLHVFNSFKKTTSDGSCWKAFFFLGRRPFLSLQHPSSMK